jgi:hypothetical protein
MIIPFTYGLLIPIFIKRMIFREAIYFYLSYIFFLTFGFFIVLFTYTYSLLTMDNIKWGKTRQIKKDNMPIFEININESIV